jgi:hypothetical protein
MAGLADIRNKALDKYDDDLNPVAGGEMAPEGMGAEAPAAPEGMPMEGEMPPAEGDLGAAPGGGEEVGLMSEMLSEAGIDAAPEQVEAFVDLLKDKAMQMADEMGGEMEAAPEAAGGMPPAEGGMPEAPPMM